jgi:hypothetical protein
MQKHGIRAIFILHFSVIPNKDKLPMATMV